MDNIEFKCSNFGVLAESRSRSQCGLVVFEENFSWNIIVEQPAPVDEHEVALLRVYKMQDYEPTRFAKSIYKAGPYRVDISVCDSLIFDMRGISDFDDACRWLRQGLTFERAGRAQIIKALRNRFELSEEQE
ncbi:hypothetical protein [Aquitalea sp.]|uniref:hypothetical protein n=1 Tax=Aquitalea sp. TaxID=1872623 RepID=UPI00258B29E7|nr:hypothetical protein [Aquitalea sp.]